MKLREIYKYSSYLLAISIPFPQKFSSYILGIWIVIYIAQCITSKNNGLSLSKEKISSILLLIFFVIGLTSVLYAEDWIAVIHKSFEQRLVILLLPLFSIFNRYPISFSKIIKFFILGNFLYITYSHILIFYDYQNLYNLELLRNFSEESTNIYNSIVHRTYSGLNILICYIGIFYLWFQQEIKQKECISLCLFVLYSLHYLMINNSRAITIALISIGIISLFLISKYRKQITLSIVIIVCIIVSLWIIPNRFKNTVLTLQQEGIESINEPRIQIWKACYNLISNNELLGFGVNNVEKPLKEEYKNIEFYDGIVENLNAHNQYFESWLEIGIIGPVLLIALIFSIPIFCNKRKRQFAILYAITLFIAMSFESILNRYSGCISFSFFLFFLSSEDDSDIETTIIKDQWTVPLFLTLIILSLFIRYYCSYFSDNFKERKIITSLIANNSEKNPFYFDYHKSRKFSSENYAKGYHIIGLSETENKEYLFEIECYVSKEFNGNEVIIYEETAKCELIQVANYDLTQKGFWQKLQLKLKTREKISIICLQSYPLDKINEINGKIYFKNAKFNK